MKIFLPLFLFLVQPLFSQLSPTLLAKGKKGTSSPLRVDQVSVEVKVIGNIAETSMTMRFRNDTDRDLEGELVFPLGEGQTIVGYALEIDGAMRDGVVVEKQLARQVFEDIVRQEIDPGLVEWTKGKNFRTRIYPIPTKGFKKVRLTYQELLSREENGLRYRLPLNFEKRLDLFSMTIDAGHAAREVKTVKDESSGLSFDQTATKGWKLSSKQKNYLANRAVELVIPILDSALIEVAKEKGGESFFYVVDQVGRPLEELPGNPKANSILLVWDASGSGEQRDHGKELELLKMLLAHHAGASVSLVLMRHELGPMGDFTASKALLEKLEELSYDGGTDPGALDLSKFSQDLVLLVTDGIGTLGNRQMTVGETPVHIFHAAPSAEHETLKSQARSTGGSYHNLASKTVGEAFAEMTTSVFRLLSVEGAEAVHPKFATPVPKDGLMNLAGRFRGVEPVTLTLKYGISGKVTVTRKITVKPGVSTSKGKEISRIWAGMEVESLLGQAHENRKAITELGREFGLVTPFTSLLVLDRIEDYIEHRIVPPTTKLREQYNREIRELEAVRKELPRDSSHLDDLAVEWAEMKGWHQKDFDPIDVLLFHKLNDSRKIIKDAIKSVKKSKRAPLVKIDEDLEALQQDLAKLGEVEVSKRRVVIKDYARRFRTLNDQLEKIAPEDPEGFVSASGGVGGVFPLSAPSPGVEAPAPPALPLGPGGDEAEEPTARISLAKWDPKTPYLKALKKAPKADWESVYFEWKKKNLKSSAFYLDVSDFLFEKGERKLALRILTNVAELDLENIPLMRILAHRLNQVGDHPRAFSLFEEVHELRPEEPQSQRDLALTLAALKRPQEAADLLWKVIKTPADDRFEGVHLISLVEVNSLIARHGLKTSKYDPRFIQNLDCDARIILTWDSDNSDMDLWVTDALGEKCNYGRNRTASGGRMSHDFTDGYGPEEFLIKSALHGEYRIEANYYGDRQQILAGATTIQVEIFTNWGRKNQKSKKITLRLGGKEEVVFVGEVELR